MESGIQSSFIPHDAAEPTVVRRESNRGLSDLFLLVSIVVLVASGALAAGVFLYDEYAQTSSASKLDQLKRAKAAFEPALIDKLTRLDDRMNAAQTILSGHMAPTAFFDALSQSTLTTISFSTLDFDATDPAHLAIKATGIAQSVNSIALQADLFSKSGTIANPIFSDISRQTDGVHFSLSAAVNPASINYERLIAAAVQSGTPALAPAVSLPSAPPATSTASSTPAQ
jgi:hypothetical protein